MPGLHGDIWQEVDCDVIQVSTDVYNILVENIAEAAGKVLC